MASTHQVALTRPPHPSTSTNVQRSARQTVPAFLQKLYQMVDDPKNSELIRWSETGDSFFVLDHDRFAREVLGRWFKHQNFSSFVRQLNMYGFHKVPHLQQGALKSEVEDFWNFAHPNFHAGQPDLLCLIHRKKQPAQLEDDSGALDVRSGNGPAGVGESSSSAPATQGGQIVDAHQIVQGIAAIKRHQTLLSEQLNELKKTNELLWQDSMSARARHQKQEDTINRIIKFLAGVFGNHPANTHRKDDEVDSTKLNQAVVPRRNTRLMIEDNPYPTGKVGILEVGDEEERDSLYHAPQYGSSSIGTPNSAASPAPSVSQSEGANSEHDYSSLFTPTSSDSLQTPVMTSSNASQLSTSAHELERAVTPSRHNAPAFEPEPRLQHLFNNLTAEQLAQLYNSIHTMDPNYSTSTDNQLTFSHGFDFNPLVLTPSLPTSQTQQSLAPTEGLISFDSTSSDLAVNHLNPSRLEKQWRATEDVTNAVNAIDPKIQMLMDSLGLNPSLLPNTLTELSASANSSVSGTGMGTTNDTSGSGSTGMSLTPFDVPVLSSTTDTNTNPTRQNEGSSTSHLQHTQGSLSMDMEGNSVDVMTPTNSHGDFNMHSFLNDLDLSEEYDGLDNLESTAFFDEVQSPSDVVNSARFSPLTHRPITPIPVQQSSNQGNGSPLIGAVIGGGGGPSGIGQKRKSDAILDLEGALGAASVNDSSNLTSMLSGNVTGSKSSTTGKAKRRRD